MPKNPPGRCDLGMDSGDPPPCATARSGGGGGLDFGAGSQCGADEEGRQGGPRSPSSPGGCDGIATCRRTTEKGGEGEGSVSLALDSLNSILLHFELVVDEITWTFDQVKLRPRGFNLTSSPTSQDNPDNLGHEVTEHRLS
ncbi:hypothetical protein AXF42_Ash016282 [Apostasia shenzhenica]|uniref:Uncharacterized protein n=1 Tax=Apostasia shenzhenica TaxID=1088818 RepID=A0A2H9ZXD5_9ASPA|nr:hypothetical protein AXF42_Ash016282 [Apostasia shenzhenica]